MDARTAPRDTTPAHTTSSSSSDDLGKLVLRLTLGALILFHGVSKMIGGIDPIAGLVVKAGLPAGFAYLVYLGEVLAPLLMILGVWTRVAALVIATNMIAAIFLAHGSEILTLSKTGGWALELQGMFLATALVVALLGAGRYSVTGSHGRWN